MLLSVVLQALVCTAFAQMANQIGEAEQLAKEGKERITAGDFQGAVEKYSRAFKLCPKDPRFQLGLAHAKFFQLDYRGAIALCKPLMSGKHAEPQAFQIYGSCLDAQGKSYEALGIYRDGLRLFPKSGALYMEMGIVEFGRHRDGEALGYWEQGISVDPYFAPNYGFAAARLLEIGAYAWAANYAEIFINLDRVGDQVHEMSALMMQAHERARIFDFEKAFKWRFFQVKDTANGKVMPAPMYEQLLDSAFSSEFMDTVRTIQIDKLAEIRRFVCFWLPGLLKGQSVRGLLKWQQAVANAGHWEAYHYWLLSDARPSEYDTWMAAYSGKFEAFEEWLSRTSIHKFIKRAVVRPAHNQEGTSR